MIPEESEDLKAQAFGPIRHGPRRYHRCPKCGYGYPWRYLKEHQEHCQGARA